MKKNGIKTLAVSMTTMALLLSGVGCEAKTDTDTATHITKEETATDSVETAAAEPAGTEPAVNISDSYDNTEELAARFPVVNPTPIDTQMEKNIQNRLLNGFENWNRGYETWEAWGDILYTPDSLYNVHGVKLTLKEYQSSMNAQLKSSDIQMGNFHNMIISGDWAAIRYDISTTDRQSEKSSDGSVMEFVHFKDYGDERGTRVVEGWAGTKGEDFEQVSSFQNDNEKAAQQESLDAIVHKEIPDTTDLEAKYPVTSPTPIDSDMGKKIKDVILNDFEKWNQGFDSWEKWADTYYDSSLQYHTSKDTLNLSEYKAAMKESADSTDTKRIQFDNMLISGDWAAIHYRITNEDKTTGEKTAGDVMQFLHFAQDGDQLKVIESWTK
ncbi:nuclear transport factor 2 family protein [Saccharibacillus alkalitolerans]|uniref:Nuclear transport factor 2 family protein n=1 Tax=Saccharibacillus alkalitolerans TaxID=2705290 RepID=A0ABX0F123_9BACL|nr:nuclear transport factor 2 family protein [Saccharibacillus alkalitolerans]NGZ74678.1 nuclear transport factor 2 family protein [Saccharibacillus alkalitolerans]